MCILDGCNHKKKYGEYCYKPIFDINQKYTYSWEKVIDIDTSKDLVRAIDIK